MLNNLVYILIFIPIFCAIAIHFCVNNKAVIQSIVFSTLFLVLVILSMIMVESFNSGSEARSNLSFDIISLSLEFRMDIILLAFVAILTIIKIVQLTLFQEVFSKKLHLNELKTYFSSHLISYFAIIGIITSNNLFNIFIFIEIYFISYFALSTIYKNKKINQQNSKQLVSGVASSMLFLIAIITLYFHFETLNLAQLTAKIESSASSSALILIACSLMTISLLVRFVPLWAFFSKNIKDSLAVSSELFFVLFINLNLLICILLKSYYIVFSTNLITSIIIISCLIVIIYSSLVMMFNRHLRSQITLLCLAIFCFMILALALKNQNSFTAFIFYWLSYNISALIMFFFITFVWNSYGISSIDEISILRKSNRFLVRNSHCLFLIIIILTIPLPNSPIFYANFFLFDAILDNNSDQLYEFNNLFDPYILVTIVLFHLSLLVLLFKMIISLIYHSKELNKKNIDDKKTGSFVFYLINLFGVVIFLYFLANSSKIQFIIEKFSKNLFNIL